MYNTFLFPCVCLVTTVSLSHSGRSPEERGGNETQLNRGSVGLTAFCSVAGNGSKGRRLAITLGNEARGVMGPLRNRAREAAVDRRLLDSPGFSGETWKQPQVDPGDTPATGHQDLQGADPGQDIGPKARGREQSEIPGAPVSFRKNACSTC